MSIIQSSRITDLETALLAARARIEELEAERDARPVVRWVAYHENHHGLIWGPIKVGEISKGGATWYASRREDYNDYWRSLKDFPTPEAAKAAVEEALRGLSAKTEGA